MITKTLFDIYEGKEVHLYTISNAEISVGILDFGGILNFIKIKTSGGEKNILLGYDCVQAYLQCGGYVGATVGRVANRIAGAKFCLDGKEYKLSPNENGNCLHGGALGFDKRFYAAETKDDALALFLVSDDGDMGFPGTLKFKAEFILGGRTFTIKYSGVSDKTTLFSPTCHAYFNMNGGGDVMGNLLKINADSYTPADSFLIPLGKKASVGNTPLDFTSFKAIGADYAKLGGGTYDHNYCLKEEFAAAAVGEESGISMKIFTDFPGLQFYVGNPCAFKGKGGGSGFCLEPQYYPDAVNAEGFEAPLLPAGTEKMYSIRYQFSFT